MLTNAVVRSETRRSFGPKSASADEVTGVGASQVVSATVFFSFFIICLANYEYPVPLFINIPLMPSVRLMTYLWSCTGDTG